MIDRRVRELNVISEMKSLDSPAGVWLVPVFPGSVLFDGQGYGSAGVRTGRKDILILVHSGFYFFGSCRGTGKI